MRDDTTRRGFLRQAAGFTLASGAVANATSRAVATTAAARPAAELTRMSALELSAAIHARRVSCVEVMQTYLAHIERVNPKVNAIVSLQDADGLLRQAHERDALLTTGVSLGWMHGLPHAVKDLAATAGIRTSYGSPLLDGVPTEDSLHVARIKAVGAIIIGKTNAPEFGLGSQTYNTVFGTTLNAYDQSKTAGGSSGGAAVSLALDMVPVADGSDMMGSLRNPAAFNNVFGFRPSFGRVPSTGGELFFDQLSVSGPMGRYVADVAALLTTMAGPDPRAPLALPAPGVNFEQSLRRDLKGVRLGWLGDLGGALPIEPGVLTLCRDSFAAFESIGASVVEQKFPFSVAKLWDTWLVLRHWSTAGDLGELYADPAKRTRLKPEAQWEIQGAKGLTAMDIYRASETRSDWYRAALNLFKQMDFLLLPSAQVFPFDATLHWPKSINDVAMDTYHRWMQVVTPASLLGLPVLNVPVGFNAQGLPMGMQIIGPPQADLAVLQLGYAYELATQWVSRRRPALLA